MTTKCILSWRQFQPRRDKIARSASKYIYSWYWWKNKDSIFNKPLCFSLKVAFLSTSSFFDRRIHVSLWINVQTFWLCGNSIRFRKCDNFWIGPWMTKSWIWLNRAPLHVTSLFLLYVFSWMVLSLCRCRHWFVQIHPEIVEK